MSDPAQEAVRAVRQMVTAGRRGDPFEIAGRQVAPGRIAEVLRPYLSERRQARIEAVLATRTNTVATVVDGVFDTGNLSAIMRSAEALGFQPFHVVLHLDAADRRRYRISNRTARGAQRWLDVFRWPSPEACAGFLTAQGYEIVAMHADRAATPLEALDFTRKTALVFGNERDGVSPALQVLADRRCTIPMCGFSQSFNVSVAAALSLYQAYRDRHARLGRHGDLSEEGRETLRALFYLRSVRHARQILQRAL
jgi:tRNA (guanosine-2'-O-)-methyltransferase